MSKQFKIFTLVVVAFSGEFAAYRLGKNVAIQEIKQRPFACVPGQKLGTPNGSYLCDESQNWKPKP